MAARHLQRLRAAQPENLDDEQSSSEEELVAKRAPFNPFDLLSDEEVKFLFTAATASDQWKTCVSVTALKDTRDRFLKQSTAVVQAGPASDDEEGSETVQNHATSSVPHIQSNPVAKMGRKAKKKKKKGALQTDKDDAGAQKTRAPDDEDLDKILSDLNIQTVR
jgi:hypothetical protein